MKKIHKSTKDRSQSGRKTRKADSEANLSASKANSDLKVKARNYSSDLRTRNVKSQGGDFGIQKQSKNSGPRKQSKSLPSSAAHKNIEKSPHGSSQKNQKNFKRINYSKNAPKEKLNLYAERARKLASMAQKKKDIQILIETPTKGRGNSSGRMSASATPKKDESRSHSQRKLEDSKKSRSQSRQNSPQKNRKTNENMEIDNERGKSRTPSKSQGRVSVSKNPKSPAKSQSRASPQKGKASPGKSQRGHSVQKMSISPSPRGRTSVHKNPRSPSKSQGKSSVQKQRKSPVKSKNSRNEPKRKAGSSVSRSDIEMSEVSEKRGNTPQKSAKGRNTGNKGYKQPAQKTTRNARSKNNADSRDERSDLKSPRTSTSRNRDESSHKKLSRSRNRVDSPKKRDNNMKSPRRVTAAGHSKKLITSANNESLTKQRMRKLRDERDSEDTHSQKYGKKPVRQSKQTYDQTSSKNTPSKTSRSFSQTPDKAGRGNRTVDSRSPMIKVEQSVSKYSSRKSDDRRGRSISESSQSKSMRMPTGKLKGNNFVNNLKDAHSAGRKYGEVEKKEVSKRKGKGRPSVGKKGPKSGSTQTGTGKAARKAPLSQQLIKREESEEDEEIEENEEEEAEEQEESSEGQRERSKYQGKYTGSSNAALQAAADRIRNKTKEEPNPQRRSDTNGRKSVKPSTISNKKPESDESELSETKNSMARKNLVKTPMKQQFSGKIDTQSISDEINKIIKRIEERKRISSEKEGYNKSKKYDNQRRVVITKGSTTKPFTPAAKSYKNKLQYKTDIRVNHVVKVSDIAPKLVMSNSDRLLTMLELATNPEFYNLPDSTRSRTFWEEVVQYNELQHIFGNLKRESLRKYWKAVCDTGIDPRIIADLVIRNKTLIDAIPIKFKTLISVISHFFSEKFDSFEECLNKETITVISKETTKEKVKDPITGKDVEIIQNKLISTLR